VAGSEEPLPASVLKRFESWMPWPAQTQDLGRASAEEAQEAGADLSGFRRFLATIERDAIAREVAADVRANDLPASARAAARL
jgi:hypothetical protein